MYVFSLKPDSGARVWKNECLRDNLHILNSPIWSFENFMVGELESCGSGEAPYNQTRYVNFDVNILQFVALPHHRWLVSIHLIWVVFTTGMLSL